MLLRKGTLMKLALLAGAAALVAACSSGTTGAFAQGRDTSRSSAPPPSSRSPRPSPSSFGQTGGFTTPVVESTGTGGGIKLFCEGVGEQTTDITNASRKIKDSEIDDCVANGVTAVEAPIGFDGIVLANAKAAPDFALTRAQIFAGARQGRRSSTAQSSRTPTSTGPTSTPRCRPKRSKSSARRRPPAPATPSSSWSWLAALRRAEVKADRRRSLQRHPRRRRLHRRRRKRQPDRPEARGQPGRGRHLRLLVPRPEHRRPQGRRDRWRRPDLRGDRRR